MSLRSGDLRPMPQPGVLQPNSHRSAPKKFAFLCLLFVLTTFAVPCSAQQERAPIANVLAASVAYQAPSTLDKSLPLGGGIVYTRDYFVTPRVALGIQAGLRVFPTPPFHLALGYGLSLKHYVGNWGTSKSSGLYLRYGLLLQMNRLEGRSGTATGHDTNLALGYDRNNRTVSPMVELGYHLTQVRSFDRDTLWWPYTEFLAGVRF